MPSKTITVSTEKWERVKAAFSLRSYELELQGKDNAPDFDEDIMTVT